MKAPPPMPEDSGSTKPSIICTAIAASTAEPPRFNTSAPASAASGCAAATMKRFAVWASQRMPKTRRAVSAALGTMRKMGRVPICRLDHQWHQKKRHDVDDLDERVDRRAGGVLVGIADGVAGDRGLVRLGSLAAVVAVLDELLGVVPRAAAGA